MSKAFHPNLTPVTIAIASALSACAASAAIGPSTSTAPYLVSVASGVEITSLLTAGDSVNLKPDGITPYRMVGIPDGLGAYENGDGNVTVLMNHELNTEKGVPRAYGAVGAFVSKWIIDGTTLAVLNGEDMVASPSKLYTWQGSDDSWAKGATAINRTCSADLPATSAFFDGANGFNGLIFMNGEESGDEGRGFAWVETGSEAGTAWELPALGNLSWENSVASPYPQGKTIVMGMDDDGLTDSQLYMYVGAKQSTGDHAVELAGLHNGTLYGLRVKGAAGVQNEDRTTGFGGAHGVGSGKFEWVSLGNVTNMTGTEIENKSEKSGVSGFRRIEDGHWDPNVPNRFYFVTTDATLPSGRSRLWRLTFDDITNPVSGGTIEMLLDGSEGQEMLDNLTVAGNGKVYLQEDQGSSANLAKVWEYDPATDTLKLLAKFDPDLFAGASPVTTNEESSGIIDVTDLVSCEEGHTCLLLDAQVHKSLSDKELVEMGQLLLMQVPN